MTYRSASCISIVHSSYIAHKILTPPPCRMEADYFCCHIWNSRISWDDFQKTKTYDSYLFWFILIGPWTSWPHCAISTRPPTSRFADDEGLQGCRNWGARGPPYFDRSVNPISTGRGQIMPIVLQGSRTFGCQWCHGTPRFWKISRGWAVYAH